MHNIGQTINGQRLMMPTCNGPQYKNNTNLDNTIGFIHKQLHKFKGGNACKHSMSKDTV